MPRENSQCRKWEKQRRNRLTEAFSALAKVLPSYDPCVNICRIDILTNAQSTIRQQQDELSKISFNKEGSKSTKGDIFRRLQERIKKLTLRNEQLRELLTTAGITIPKSIETFPVGNTRFKKGTPEQAKIFQKKEMEKENKSTHIKKKKVKFASAPVTLKRPKPDSKPLNKLPTKKRKTEKTSTAAPCLLVLSQPPINAGINNSCFLLSNQQFTPTKSIPSVAKISSTFPIINPPLSSLGPGTLVLANGTVLPVVPKQQVFISNTQYTLKKTKCMTGNSVNIPKTSSQITHNKCEKQDPQANKSRLIRPKKYCVTNTTQINKVPIPALTSDYANNQLLLNEGCLIVENSRCSQKKLKDIPKGKRTKVIKRKIETPVEVDVEKSKEGKSSDKVVKENEITNESEKITVGKESSIINTSQSSISTTTSADQITTTNQKDDKICSAKANTQILDNKEKPDLDKITSKDEQVRDENDLKKTKSESINVSHSGKNLTCLASSTSCDDNMKNLELNLAHSELSNDDIFASLHVPPGCQNPESTSPTAAFLMAFPLVSSVKATDVIDDDHSSQRQTPTLLQIGTMDSTKHTHTDTLAGSLLNLDSFSFFNAKDVCENYYESCTNILPKENQMSSSEMKNKVECVNVDSSTVATSESGSLESVLSNCGPQKNDHKVRQNMHYSVFHNSDDNHKTNVQFDSSEKVSYEVYTDGKSSIAKDAENSANKSSNITENVSCNTYPEVAKDPNRNNENVENMLVSTDDTSKKTEQVYNESVKPNNFDGNKNSKTISYQDTKMKETQEYISCQETELKDMTGAPITFPHSDSDKEIEKTNPYNIYQERSMDTVTGLNVKQNSGNDEVLCNFNQQTQNHCSNNASTNDVRVHHNLIYNNKDGPSKEIIKKSNVDYELHENIIPQNNLYKSFHDSNKKKNAENNINETPYIYPRSGVKSSNQCNSVNTNSAIIEKESTHLYSVDNMSFNNNFQMKSTHTTGIGSCDKSSANNKLTENISYNIFEITHPAKTITSSVNANNSNRDGKLSHTVQHQNCKKDVSKATEDKSQCYYSMVYPDSSYNINFKNDPSKLCPTCSYMNLNKTYSNPLYTNSTNYNYYPDGNINQNYYKTSTPKNDTKSYYSLNYENYQEYKKSEGTNFPKSYGSSSSIQREGNIVDKTNSAKDKCIPQNKLVNWMTTPENKVQPSDTFLTFPNQSYSFTSCVSGEASDISNILEPKKHLDASHLAEDKQFSWSQSKLPSFLDQTHNFVTPTLPTLVGDLALGNPVPFNDQKTEYKYPKDQKRKNNAYENQTNFLSVSQLVDHNKTEHVPSRITTRRSSGGRSKNTVQMKNKRPSKNESNDKVCQIKPTDVFNGPNRVFNEFKSGNHGKNTSSSYSAEALIGNQITDTSKKYPSNSSKPMGSTSFLTENIITYFPAIEENYLNQNQNFQNNLYTHNSFQTTNNSAVSTNSFIYTTPTITSSYLSSNFEAPCYYKQSTSSKDDKNSSYNSFAKKAKKKLGNESINSGFANFEFPLLPMPGSTNSPILPDDFHTPASFLPPTAPYPAKTSMYQKQGNDFTPNGLLPLPGLPRNNTQLPDVSPSLNSVGTSLTNFNLSTIFPEINKRGVSNVYQDNRSKEHSSTLQMPFNLEPKYTFS
ncbi:unnamed protein product [Phaedon cochleariae]|uniref:BHLH domain-containing protein n=1 Tax=Phaedon cochleariae TaxID=80249 RepID=A0A9N9X2V9_PHACE|nr:unnamed protein product [Phaedon cochleariae]